MTNRLWSITSYFNPGGYQSRLHNYRVFRQHLRVPLIAVELAFDTQPFQLAPDDAEIIVQLRDGDVMWQKERLLNLALQRLPRECEVVAWLDCDVVFGDEQWPARAHQALRDYRLIQLFSQRCNLARGATISGSQAAVVESVAQSLGYKIANGLAEPDDVRVAGAAWTRNATTGLGWAASRELLDRYHLYDACVVGNGDRAMLAAALGKFSYGAEALRMNPRQIQHYLKWASPFAAAVSEKVGYIEGSAFHLWHGHWSDRKAAQRHQGFAAFEFDPFIDLALDGGGSWRWNTDKPAMHEFVRSYFAGRNEDGVGLPASASIDSLSKDKI